MVCGMISDGGDGGNGGDGSWRTTDDEYQWLPSVLCLARPLSLGLCICKPYELTPSPFSTLIYKEKRNDEFVAMYSPEIPCDFDTPGNETQDPLHYTL